MRGATIAEIIKDGGYDISTHAPRAGSDADCAPCGIVENDFNPRSPCGERRISDQINPTLLQFQPTLPVRGATQQELQEQQEHKDLFQPTLPVRGATIDQLLGGGNEFVFQPTLPVRGATIDGVESSSGERISTHAPRAGSDK